MIVGLIYAIVICVFYLSFCSQMHIIMTEKKTNQKVAPCKTNTENTFLPIYGAISRHREIITGKFVGIWQGRLIELLESLNVFKIISDPKSLH